MNVLEARSILRPLLESVASQLDLQDPHAESSVSEQFSMWGLWRSAPRLCAGVRRPHWPLGLPRS